MKVAVVVGPRKYLGRHKSRLRPKMKPRHLPFDRETLLNKGQRRKVDCNEGERCGTVMCGLLFAVLLLTVLRPSLPYRHAHALSRLYRLYTSPTLNKRHHARQTFFRSHHHCGFPIIPHSPRLVLPHRPCRSSAPPSDRPSGMSLPVHNPSELSPSPHSHHYSERTSCPHRVLSRAWTTHGGGGQWRLRMKARPVIQRN